MKIVATILIVLVQCIYLRAAPNPLSLEDFVGSDSCLLGAQSVSVVLYNSRFSKGKDIEMEECCANIDSSDPVFFIVHGFISSANATNFRNLASELSQKGNTVFVVDWSQGACTDGIPIVKLAEYPQAVKNTREIGNRIANYTTALLKKCNVPIENIKYIGHSLGAHVSGFAAKNVTAMIGETIPFILALDPAAPFFENNDCKDRLCKSDTKRLVQFKTSTLGISKRIGHLYLQFGRGKMQPGCSINVSCSHSESIVYATDVVEDKCKHLAIPLDESLWGSLKSPKYPTSNTTDCIVVNSNILKSDNPMEGDYRVFPECAKETFNCKQ
ncbi:phospholipase A1 [Monomorium pharaonis]|uniref:phospholipase A1 n=1 Tax=Monomorium pharaonis TaxID=307658 RepID=UPI001746743D|nr:phospholipase A1 [Monomorium pharaonis]